jgi:hypothetical protein
MGNEADILDTSLFPETARLAIQYGCCNNQRSVRLEVQGRELELERYGSVWWRRPQPPRLSEQMLRHSHRAFAANEIYRGDVWTVADARCSVDQ